MRNESVLLPWMNGLPLRQQGIILSSLRGYDLSRSVAVKNLNKWVRSVVQHNVDPSSSYMRDITPPEIDRDLKEDLECCSMHYVLHLMYSLEIIGYKHPDKSTGNEAKKYYYGFADFFHLNAETEEQMDKRLENKV